MNNNGNFSAQKSSRHQSDPQSSSSRPRLSFYSFLKYLAIFGAVFFTAIIQTGFFLKWRPLGTSPDLCLALCVATSLKWGSKKGVIVGIMSGFCLDAFSSIGFSPLIPFYFILCTIIGLFAEGKNTSGFSFFISAMPIAALFRVLLIFFELCLSTPTFSASEILIHTILPHFIITLLFSPIFYLAVVLTEKLFGKKDRTTKH